MNQLTISGNVGRDAEIRYTSSGVAVVDFSVAVNKVSGSGENRTEKTTWVKVTVWREYGERIQPYIKKGMKILISGEASVSAYIDKSGNAAASLELTANSVEFVSPKQQNGDSDTKTTNDDEIPF